MADPVHEAGDGEPPIDPGVAITPPAAASSLWDPPVATTPERIEAPGAGAEPPEPAVKADKGKKKDEGALAFLRELPALLLVAFLLALLIKTFLVQAFYIPSESMEPTLNVGDRVLVNKVVYHLHSPRRGDIIVFSDPHPAPQPHRNPVSAFAHWLTDGLGVTTSPDKDFIKRVIGLPGETIEIHGGVVIVDGKSLDEPYLTAAAREIGDFGPRTIPSGSLFVMGDNRPNSNDSRFQLGYIPLNKVIGRAFVVIWPPSRVRLLHGL